MFRHWWVSFFTILFILQLSTASNHTCEIIGCGHHDDVCWCSDSCHKYNDCCEDYEQTCVTKPEIEFLDVNVLYTTDMHSWLEGGYDVKLDATIADAKSFVERIREIAAKKGKDVFVFDNGDIQDGTGLSAIAPDHVDHVAPLMREMPYDALNCGNHELYQLNGHGDIPAPACGLDGLNQSGFIQYWNGRYLTSNIEWAENRKPVGNLYTVLQGKVSGIKLLVFGFLYDMPDAADVVHIVDVEDVVQAQWFSNTLSENSDVNAVIVLAHMDYKHKLLKVILDAVRSHSTVYKTMPVQFLTGHSHIRGWRQIDNYAASYEAGCKLNTFGFASFELRPSKKSTQLKFVHADIDGSLKMFSSALNLSSPKDLPTRAGIEFQKNIDAVRDTLRLDDKVGCAIRDYKVHTNITTEDSLWRKYMQEIVPATIFTKLQPGHNGWFVFGNGGLVRDIKNGSITLEDVYRSSPWANYFYQIPQIPGKALASVLSILLNGKIRDDRTQDPYVQSSVPYYVASSVPDTSKIYDLIYVDFDADPIEKALNQTIGRHPPRSPLDWPNSNCTSIMAQYSWDQC